MGLYQVILAPAVFVTDGRARVWQETGALVELTEDEAASFDPPESLQLLNTEAPVEEPQSPTPSGQPVVFVDEAADTPPAASPEPVDENAPASSGRRGRAKAGGGDAVNDQD